MARTRSRSKNGNSHGQVTWDERLIRQLIPWRTEIAGLIVFVFSVISFLGLVGLTGSGILGMWTALVRQLTGWGAYPFTLAVAAAGLYFALRRVEHPIAVRPGQVVGTEMVFLVALSVVHMALGNGLTGALAGRGGGLVGWALSEPILEYLGPFMTVLLQALLLTWGVALIMGTRWADIVSWLNRASVQLLLWSNELEADAAEREAELAEPSTGEGAGAGQSGTAAPARSLHQPDELIVIEDSSRGVGSRAERRDDRLPPLSLLEEGSTLTLTTEEIDQKKRLIEQTLGDFGLPAVVTEVRRGPTVTQFGVQPGYIERIGSDGQIKEQKVRVGQIAGLQKDLALALAVTRLRIEAPVPGRGIVGIEVPNAETNVVRLRPIIASKGFQRIRSPMTVALGQDVTGSPVATDISRLPHLLIAGTTGSGKSVCLNAIITSLAFNNSPEQLRMVMIDPKKVELIRFNGMPHLMGKVEADPDRVVGVLNWLTGEMDRRYEFFASLQAKNLADFNHKVSRRQDIRPLPYMAVFIDELADLMAAYPGEVERTLCRLAQMARATGIHLVVATQRPSTDVITGLIKANFPARASFAVASSTDSRVILDTVGAEQLLGRGDMLFLPPDASAPVRVQGCFVSDREIEGVVSYWQRAVPGPEEFEEAPWEALIARDAFISERDEMLERAIALAQKRDDISTSYIQRRLRVGYPRAARLMETLYEMGLVEDPKDGGRTRRTFVNEDDDPLDEYLNHQD
jgi:DNA segregation ATPase FtsK/SpoIIIE, S-DNA-T family